MRESVNFNRGTPHNQNQKMKSVLILAGIALGLIAYAQQPNEPIALPSSPPPAVGQAQHAAPGAPVVICGHCGAHIAPAQPIYVAAPVNQGPQYAGEYYQPRPRRVIAGNPHLPGPVHYHQGVACDGQFEEDCQPYRIPPRSIFPLSDQWAVSANRIHRRLPNFGHVPAEYYGRGR